MSEREWGFFCADTLWLALFGIVACEVVEKGGSVQIHIFLRFEPKGGLLILQMAQKCKRCRCTVDEGYFIDFLLAALPKSNCLTAGFLGFGFVSADKHRL